MIGGTNTSTTANPLPPLSSSSAVLACPRTPPTPALLLALIILASACLGLGTASQQQACDNSSSGQIMEVATVGGGCFWCIQACYSQLKGVVSAYSGYAGGHVPNPTYDQVCGKQTGHAEVVQVTFDPQVISYSDILKVFFTIHDPTTPNRQGNDVGPQYRSIILYHSEQQRETAEQMIQWVGQQGWYSDPVVTELVKATVFYPGEDYHQDYFEKNPGQGYCRAVVAPKVQKFRSKFFASLKQ